MKKQFQNAKPGKGRPGSKREPKRVIMFDDAVREEYLTGFHKRKLERRKAAVVEIKNKIKDEQKRVRDERHKEYLRLLAERREALDEEEEEEEDELEDAITATTESVQYDHPNHTVTVTTISDLDLSGCGIHGPATNQVAGDNANEEGETEAGNMSSMPKKSFQPILNKKICSLNASLHSNTKQGKRKGKAGKGKLGRMPDQKPARGATDRKNRLGRTSKKQRRKQTGKRIHHQD